MIIKTADGAPPNFFLIGFRAPPGGAAPPAEKVGVFIARSVVRFDGLPGSAADIRTEDELFSGPGGLKFESEIAPWKPQADVAVARQGVGLSPYGSVRIDRGAGFGPALACSFGWIARTEPPRDGRAGDAGGFDPDHMSLPDNFSNAFHNGAPLAPAQAPFVEGDRISFEPAGAPQNALVVTMPSAPRLAARKEGKELPPLPQPQVDTVVMDEDRGEFSLVWRATFPWRAEYDGASLEVS
jgi:hypothetical protein